MRYKVGSAGADIIVLDQEIVQVKYQGEMNFDMFTELRADMEYRLQLLRPKSMIIDMTNVIPINAEKAVREASGRDYRPIMEVPSPVLSKPQHFKLWLAYALRSAKAGQARPVFTDPGAAYAAAQALRKVKA